MIEVVQGLPPNIVKGLDPDQGRGVVQGRDQDQEKDPDHEKGQSPEDPDLGKGRGHEKGQSQGQEREDQGENIIQQYGFEIECELFLLKVFGWEGKNYMFIV